MDRTPHQDQKIRDSLGPKLRACPVCGLEGTWILYDKYHLLQLQSVPTTMVYPESVVPCVVIFCKNCGNVQMHSVHALGIAEVLGIPSPGKEM